MKRKQCCYSQCSNVDAESNVDADARLYAGVSRRTHVSDILRNDLHWLSIPKRIRLKLCSIVYCSLHGDAPIHLSKYCVPLAATEGRVKKKGWRHWVIWCYPDHVRRHMVCVPSVCLGKQVGMLSHLLVLRTWTYPTTILNRSSRLICSIRLQLDSYVTLTMGINCSDML